MVKKVYIDAEWVLCYKDYEELKNSGSPLFDAFERYCYKLKSNNNGNKIYPHYNEDVDNSVIYDNEASKFSEFNKLICLSYGYYNDIEFVTKSLYSKSADEFETLNLIKEFFDKVKHYEDTKGHKYIFCGYSIKKFDLPFIFRRMVINNIKVPVIISDLLRMKPWEINNRVLDLQDVWSFNIFGERFIPLDFILSANNITSSKSIMMGSDVSYNYHNGISTIEDIVKYCEEDVKREADLDIKLQSLITNYYNVGDIF